MRILFLNSVCFCAYYRFWLWHFGDCRESWLWHVAQFQHWGTARVRVQQHPGVGRRQPHLKRLLPQRPGPTACSKEQQKRNPQVGWAALNLSYSQINLRTPQCSHDVYSLFYNFEWKERLFSSYATCFICGNLPSTLVPGEVKGVLSCYLGNCIALCKITHLILFGAWKASCCVYAKHQIWHSAFLFFLWFFRPCIAWRVYFIAFDILNFKFLISLWSSASLVLKLVAVKLNSNICPASRLRNWKLFWNAALQARIAW